MCNLKVRGLMGLIFCAFAFFLFTVVFVGCQTEVSGPAGADGVNGVNGADGVSIVWLGSFSSEDGIENPQRLNAYYNTTDGCSYIYDGTKWTLLAKAGADWKDVLSEESEQNSGMIVLVLPNDNGETVKITNDSAPIRVSLPESFQISKIVWKKCEQNTAVSAEELLYDSDAQPVVLNFSNKGTFNVTENGWYYVAARDAAGRCDWSRVEVKTIDKNPAQAEKLCAFTKNGFAKVEWKNVAPSDEYDSPLKSLKIKYVYNDDATDSNNVEISVAADAESASIRIPASKTKDDFVRLTVLTEDEAGNIGEETKLITWCTEVIYATFYTFKSRLNEMTASGTIAYTGLSPSDEAVFGEKGLGKCLKDFYRNRPDIMVSLDLSEATGLTCVLRNAFFDCPNLEEISLPESIMSIEPFAFQDCKNLKKVTLSKNLACIRYCAFNNTYGVEMTIPKSVNRIGNLALPWYGSWELLSEKLHFEDETTNWYRGSGWPDFDGFTDGKLVGPMGGDGLMEFYGGTRYSAHYSEKYVGE